MNSGSEKRQRSISLSVRVTEQEAELVRTTASAKGVSVGSLFRYAVFDQRPLRASRRPRLGTVETGQMLGMLGRLSADLRTATRSGSDRKVATQIDAVHRDLAELRAALFEALGREP